MNAPEERRDLPAPEELKWIVRTLTSRGFEAWAVGGAVRDALSGRRPDDWDVTTSAPPREVQRAFRRTVPVGIAHGTVGVLARSGRLYEVTTYRRDIETDGRHARVAFSDRLEEDLARRDFTINAVAWHPLTGEVRDPHQGMEDLRTGILRTVGDPHQRFDEDRLRVLRALRFAGTFDLRIDPGTWVAIRASADRLERLSPERVREELWKVLSSQPRPSTSLALYAESGVLAHLYPELEKARHHRAHELDVDAEWDYLLRCVDAIPRNRPLLRLTALLHRVGTGEESPTHNGGRSAAVARSILQRLRFSNATTDTITHLVAHHRTLPDREASDATIRSWVRLVGREHVNDLFRLRIALTRGSRKNGADLSAVGVTFRSVRRVLRERPPLSIAELAITGEDLRGEGIPPGPRYGRILNMLLDRVIEDPESNNRETLLRLVRASELE